MAHPTKANEHPSRNRRRNSRGLTTLEWLLIVAAVAGLAALAVVLVQNVVDDTAEQISGSSARLTAARVAAAEVNEEPDAGEKQAKCLRLRITYGDAFEDAGINESSLVASSGAGYLFDTSTMTCKIPDPPAG